MGEKDENDRSGARSDDQDYTNHKSQLGVIGIKKCIEGRWTNGRFDGGSRKEKNTYRSSKRVI